MGYHGENIEEQNKERTGGPKR